MYNGFLICTARTIDFFLGGNTIDLTPQLRIYKTEAMPMQKGVLCPTIVYYLVFFNTTKTSCGFVLGG
jgi:hypothetical protein